MMNIYEIAYEMVLDLRQEIVPALRMEMGENQGSIGGMDKWRVNTRNQTIPKYHES